MYTYRWAIGLLGTVAAVGLPAHAQDFTASAGVEYTTGDYGGGGETDVLYAPFSLGLESDDWLVRVTLPWLELSGPGIFLGEDIPLVRDINAPVRGASEDVSGFGDVSLTIGRGFDLDAEGNWRLDATGRVKFATADETDGLSTGEMDYSMALDLTRNLGAWSVFGGGGYRINGDPDARDLNDTAFASLGAAYYMESGTSWGAALDYSQAATEMTDDALEASSWVSFRLSEKVRLQTYAIGGLSDGGPDYGAGMRLALKL